MGNNFVIEDSFGMIRTNPRLTTNIKFVVSSDDKLYLESFNSSSDLGNSKYNHYLLNDNSTLAEIPKFYGTLPINTAYTPKLNNDADKMYNNYENQFDSMYFSGANEVEDNWYNEEYSKGGEVSSLEKELHKLQWDLNSIRLLTYMEGDKSEEEIARKKEREVK